MTTHILLDIDGVVNAIYPSQAQKELTDLSGEWKEGYIGQYKFHWNQEVIDYLNDLFKQHNLVILSTWRQLAIDKVFPELGLHIPDNHIVLDKDTDPTSFQDPNPFLWWKATFAKEFIESYPNDSFIWIDDDLKAVGHYSWTDDYNILFVSPDTSTGISLKDMQTINAYLTDL